MLQRGQHPRKIVQHELGVAEQIRVFVVTASHVGRVNPQVPDDVFRAGAWTNSVDHGLELPHQAVLVRKDVLYAGAPHISRTRNAMIPAGVEHVASVREVTTESLQDHVDVDATPTVHVVSQNNTRIHALILAYEREKAVGI